MFNPLNLEGRRILVTGASSGLGRSICIVLSKCGANVALVARSEGKLAATRELMAPGDHSSHSFDLSKTSEITAWMKQLAVDGTPFDGLVHCAGVHVMLPLRTLTSEALTNAFRINVDAGLQLARGFRQRKVCAESGSIVFLASVMAMVGQPGVAGYCATKGAVASMTRALALELVSQKIRVNCIAPGIVRTEMTEDIEKSLPQEHFAAIEKLHPLGLGEPEDIAHMTAFLLADTGRWITGSTITIDGGYTAH